MPSRSEAERSKGRAERRGRSGLRGRKGISPKRPIRATLYSATYVKGRKPVPASEASGLYISERYINACRASVQRAPAVTRGAFSDERRHEPAKRQRSGGESEASVQRSEAMAEGGGRFARECERSEAQTASGGRAGGASVASKIKMAGGWQACRKAA